MKLGAKRVTSAFLIAAAVLAIALSAPKAGHALAAALVQVTNTWATPAITIDPSKAASQQILLQTPFGSTLVQGKSVAMVQLSPTQGSNNSTYVVPAGQQLVVTGVELILYSKLTTPMFMRINVPSGPDAGSYAYEYFNQLPAGMQQFSFPQGVVYPPGSSVIFDNTNGNSDAEVIVRGYLTSL